MHAGALHWRGRRRASAENAACNDIQVGASAPKARGLARGATAPILVKNVDEGVLIARSVRAIRLTRGSTCAVFTRSAEGPRSWESSL